MFKRVVTSVIGLPLLVLVVNFGGTPLALLLTFLSVVGLRELYLAFSKKNRAIHLVGYVFTIVYYASTAYIGVSSWLLIELTLLIIAVQACLVLFYKQIPLQESIMTIYGFFYVSFLLSFIYLIREHEYGRYYVWLVFTSSFGCDTFAYLTGKAFGRYKLKDTPSPSKTLEGIIGGVAGAALVGWLYGIFVSRVLNFTDIQIALNAAIISVCGAAFSIIGDMTASALKRHTGIKDFGKIFPGHGGVLDRFDSVIITAPIVYLAMTAILWI
ncbi:MAG: phosphatidate cytidylyltransferase, partial [Defluviitaleaceae bacterium]|nr:phosphatidate cytidylyltransferase [Defluviitaleaceae bacterium]